MTAEELLQETTDTLAAAEEFGLKSAKLAAKGAQLADKTARAFAMRGESVRACNLGCGDELVGQGVGMIMEGVGAIKRGHCLYIDEAEKMPDVPLPMPRGGGR